MIAIYRKPSRRQADAAAERDMGALMGVVAAVRAIRGEMRVPPGATLAVTAKTAGAHTPLLRAHAPLVQSLARARLTVDPRASRPRHSGLGGVGATDPYAGLGGLLDLPADRPRPAEGSRPAR